MPDESSAKRTVGVATLIGLIFVVFGMVRGKVISEFGGPQIFAVYAYLGGLAALTVSIFPAGIAFGLQLDAATRGQRALVNGPRSLLLGVTFVALTCLAVWVFGLRSYETFGSSGLIALSILLGLAATEVARVMSVPVLQAANLVGRSMKVSVAIVIISSLAVLPSTMAYGESGLAYGTMTGAVFVVLIVGVLLARSRPAGELRAPDAIIPKYWRAGSASLAAGVAVSLTPVVVRSALVGSDDELATAGFFAAVALMTVVRSGVLNSTAAVVQAEYASFSPGEILGQPRAVASIRLAGAAAALVVLVGSISWLTSLLFSSEFRFSGVVFVLLALATVGESWTWCAEAPLVVDRHFRRWLIGPLLGLLCGAALTVSLWGSMSSELAALITLSVSMVRAVAVPFVLPSAALRRRALVLLRPAVESLVAVAATSLVVAMLW